MVSLPRPCLSLLVVIGGWWPCFIAIVRQVFAGNEVVMSSDVTEPQHYGSLCVHVYKARSRLDMSFLFPADE